MKKSLRDQKVFNNFCKQSADREDIILKILIKYSIPHTVVVLEGARHIFLFPKNLQSSEDVNVLIAHYDRVDGTPGANDNSAAVFYLLNHGKRLNGFEHSTVIIFTDREEINEESSVKNQGAYALGNYFKSKKLTNLRFYIFDMCGVGTTLILGTAGEQLIKKHYGSKFSRSNIKSDIDKVKKSAEKYLLDQNDGEFFYLTPLFSDDLGLILNEYPSILISLLPYREAVEYKNDQSKLPKSWRCNHTIDDTPDTLDPKSWDIISPLLLKLSGVIDSKNSWESDGLSYGCYTQKIVNREIVEKKIYPLKKYITKEAFNYSDIKTNNTLRLRTFLLFASETEPEVVEFLKDLLPNSSLDITFDIYNYIKKLVVNEFNLLPLKIRDIIYRLAGDNTEESLISYLYNNTLTNIKNSFFIDSEPLNERLYIDLTFKKIRKDKFTLRLSIDNKVFAELSLNSDDHGYILKEGLFNPKVMIKLDSLNMLKGLRRALIKWLKLNNNSSLRINLDESKWIGCYQLFNLIKMELDGRTREPFDSKLVYIWKGYYGK